MDQATKAGQRYNKQQKGVAGLTSNSTKGFSKMTTGITGGLVPAYATLAANVFAVSAAFHFFKRAADVQILEQSQIRYASTTGLALQSVTEGLRQASNGMLGFREAAEAAAIGVAKGFSPAQLEKLAAGAQRAAAALGRGFEDAFDRLIRGASKAEPELLDELGITLRLKIATESYAKSLGVQADALTATQRSQAVLLETQRQLDELFGTGPAEANPFVVLAKTFEDLTRAGTDGIMPMIGGIVDIINKSGMAAIAVFGALGLSILGAMLPANMIGGVIDDMVMSSAHGTALAMNDQMEYKASVDASEKALRDLAKSASQKSAGTAMKAGAGKSKLVTKLAAGDTLSPMQKGRVKKMLKEAETQYRIHGEIVKGTFKGMNIQIVEDMKRDFLKMDKTKVGFFKRMRQSFKRGRLNTKSAFAKMRGYGTTAFKHMGKAAQWAGGKIQSMMKFAGAIGVIVMISKLMMKLIESPFTIISSLLGAFDQAANFALKTFKVPLEYIGKGIDFIGDYWKTLINVMIGGYNSIIGIVGGNPLEEFETGAGGAFLAMQKLTEEGVNTKKMFQESDAGTWALDIETTADKANTQTANLAATLELFEKMGGDVNATVKGLTSSLKEVTLAEKGNIVATSMASLSLSDRIEAIYETTRALDAQGNEMEFATMTVAQQEEAMRALRREMINLKKLSPAMAAAFNNPNMEEGLKTMKFIELHSTNATTSVKAFKDGIKGVNAAIGDGNLSDAEYLLNTLKKNADSATRSYALLGDEASLAASQAAQKEYSEALGETIGDTQTYHTKLTALRLAQEAHNVSVETSNFLTGRAGELRKLTNEETGFSLQLQEIEIQLLGKITQELRDQLNLKKKLLDIKAKEAEIALITATQGAGMGAAARVGGIVAEQNKANDGTPSSAGKAMNDAYAAISPMQAELAKLGPDGELLSTVIDGAMAMGNAFGEVFAAIEGDGLTMQTGLAAAAAGIQAISAIMAASSKATIAGIDREISAEKKRDGKSAASVAKLKVLELKKEKAKKKAFEVDKKMKMASTVIATATGMMQAFAHSDPLTGVIMAAMIGAMGAAQLAIISGTSYQGGGGVGAAAAPSAIAIGERKSTVDLAKGNNASGELGYARGVAGQGGMTDFKPTSAFSGYKNRAAGGYIVGEQGPEIFMPETPGEIISAGATAGAPTNVNFSIQAIDSAGVEELLINQRGNIITMIREAANSHGEFFLESVTELTQENQR